MKVNVEIDCTPEEARRLVGLPDLTPLHEQYVAQVSEVMRGGIRPEMIETIVRNWSPMGEAGIAMWRRMIDAGTGAAKKG